MNNNKYSGIVFFILHLPLVFCSAQIPSEMESIKNKNKGEKAVIINDAETVVIDVVNNKYKITEYITKETLLLDNSSNSTFANDQVYDSYFIKIKEIDAKTLVPSGNKYKIKNVEKIIDSNNQSGNVFYDEVITKSFVFPALQEGAITSLKYIREVNDPLMIGSFFFKWHIPCEISTITIKADKKARIKYKLYNTDSIPLEFSLQEKGKYNMYTWTVKNIKSTNYEADAPDSRYYFPHVVYYIENPDPTDNQKVGLDGLYRHYFNFIRNLNSIEDQSIQLEVNKIIEGTTSEIDKVKQIFYWVQDHINYIAFEEGMQGFVPDPAVNVFNKRYGDCKGMSSLLHYMLQLAGIKSNLTWIGTRHLPYKYTDLPSKIVDNHMIVTYYNNNQPIFLDATNNHLLFGYPSSMIQGKQAFVSFDEENYKIEEVPALTCDKNTLVDSIVCNINGNMLEGNGLMSLTGYNKFLYTSYLLEKEQIKSKENVLSIVSKGNNKFFLDTFTMENLNSREFPLHIKYQFHLSDYFRQIDDEIYINLNLTKTYNNATFDITKRQIPYENEQNTFHKLITVINIPKGYQVSYLPSEKSGEIDKLSFKISYYTNPNQVIQIKEIKENFFILDPKDFSQWNKLIEKLNLAYRDVLILKKQ